VTLDKPARFEVRIGQCDTCRWRDPDAPSTCRAFPDGIDIRIIGDVIDHHVPLPGDHGFHHCERPRASAAGPINYVLVGNTLEYGGHFQGAVWASDAGAGGFVPASWLPEEARVGWDLEMRRAWQRGIEPTAAIAAITDRASHSTFTIAVGPHREVGGTAALVRRVG
jgi:hypothetical protein